MKTVLLYILVVVILLLGGFIYLELGNKASNPFRNNNIGSPAVTAGPSDADKVIFKNYGPAPEFKSITQWLNGEPQTMANLQGQVVLINFWTYSCITCVHGFAQLNEWNKKYYDLGLRVVSIHTPEYLFEKVTASVETAIERYNITYPVAQDNSYAMWNAYNNQFWPATYLIDRDGKIVYVRYGEGKYEVTENAIKQLIGLSGGLALPAQEIAPLPPKPAQKFLFGVKHPEFLSSNELPSAQEQVYTLPDVLRRNAFALEGIWKLGNDKASLTQGFGRIRLNFNAAKVRLNAQSIKPVTIKVKVDDKAAGEITIQASGDYELFTSDKIARHTLELEIPQPGFEPTSFIFD